MVLEILCEGNPYQIGHAHGSNAKEQIRSSIEFYNGMFQKTSKMDWAAVRRLALEDFQGVIQRKWPAYMQEMQGIADGAGLDVGDIIALNVRSEIAFGLFSDGCTSLSWHSDGKAYVCQNWDWMEEQKPNVVLLHIKQEGKPTIKLLTESGQLGKIGLNSAGVGLCVNAIRAYGMDPTRLPIHIAWRMVLECSSKDEAVAKLEKYGLASSCHTLIADPTGAVGIEWSSIDFQKLYADSKGRVCHSNHYLLDHPGVTDTNWLTDSTPRAKRICDISEKCDVKDLTVPAIQELFKDETGLPGAICRMQEGESTAATLFNIVTDLVEKKAYVTLGRPTAPEGNLVLSF
ncbi:AAT-domain-containing protein [Rhizodiscina lignyota]|uniref:AAT-domain-containing protein n=1 Tax=Rhizodiscina lignyota TaxID=1504668 RepID=A0A9P4IP78_9PEZI|nr:AAT-domain-containing protein [Rhizodiscina lignyota]